MQDMSTDVLTSILYACAAVSYFQRLHHCLNKCFHFLLFYDYSGEDEHAGEGLKNTK